MLTTSCKEIRRDVCEVLDTGCCRKCENTVDASYHAGGGCCAAPSPARAGDRDSCVQREGPAVREVNAVDEGLSELLSCDSCRS